MGGCVGWSLRNTNISIGTLAADSRNAVPLLTHVRALNVLSYSLCMSKLWKF
jgi:hypothetical protein